MSEVEDDQCHPVVNVEEKIGKTVGRRKPPKPSRIQELGGAIYRSRGFTVCPKGVYKFHSNEEADAWLRKHTVRRMVEEGKRTS